MNDLKNVDLINVLKVAYNDTLTKYNYEQAHMALISLIRSKDTSRFTNQNGNRDKLDSILKVYNIYEILSKIGINLDNEDEFIANWVEKNII